MHAHGSGSEGALSAEQLRTFTVSDLKKFCRARSLKVSGKKDDLVERIVAHDSASGAEDEFVPLDSPGAATRRAPAGSLQERSREGGSLPERTAEDKFVEALDKDELDDRSLEEIFNIHMPEPGEVVTGTVTSMMEWGAFVELDDTGWSGLIHVSEISDEFIENIEDYLHPGQRVEAMVIRSPGDRLDRLSLSIRRLHSPPALHKALANGQITPQELGTLRKTSSGPASKRMTHLEDVLNKMEVRLSAVEAVLIQLGHGRALQAAQVEAQDGTQKPSVPPMEMLLSGIPPPGEERARSQKESEKEQIESVLQDLIQDDAEVYNVDGDTRPLRSNAINLATVPSPRLRQFGSGDIDAELEELEELDSAEEPSGQSVPRHEEQRATSQPEMPDPVAISEPVADMLSDAFITSTGLPGMPM